VMADSSAAIPFFNLEREAFLEYDISRLIHQVQQWEKPVVAIVSGLPLRGDAAAGPMPGRPQPGRWAFLDELERLYTVHHVEAEAELPDNADLLMLVHPREIAEERMRAIDRALLSGTPLLALVDPASYWQRANNPADQMMMMGMPPPDTGSDLEAIFAANGITFSRGSVVADPALATPVSVQQGAPSVRYPLWLSLRQPESDSPLAANLNELLFPEAGFLGLEDGSPLGMTPLLTSSAEAGVIGVDQARFTPPDRIGQLIGEDRAQRVIAALFEGVFRSAFAAQSNEAGEDAGDADGEPPAPTEGRGILVVVADVDFLADDFAVRVMNLFGMRAATPLNDNLAFLFNAVDSLTGSPQLVSLRGKGSSTRPFTVVEEMQRRAQEAYQGQLAQLEERLMEVQRELSQLQQRQPGQRELLGSPETRAAIEQFRLEEAQVRAEQRNIRKRLREDVEALNLRLALINMLAVPLLVCVAGVVYFWKFHRT
jgi:ABC-type uncharacterized transport system involved in gliding motility auxiliary subunit